ncbi:SDR family oxidoreductase [uncultured Marinobacter sp.]|uniref:SDR family NAD(P)-dependent oxidoreductase n=1 Tax=uncultured Marinobacter sp. TaxID=187379 RepID=UPI002608BA6C|nr:SDR family oxidoreductase [uncultured Marinobacter sp.]
MVERQHSFVGQVVVVTGAGGAIGQSICNRFLQLGASVVALDLEFKESPVHEGCHAVECDISSEGSVQQACDVVRKEFGRCDVLVNNAAIMSPVCSILETSLALWEQILKVNLTGAFLTTTLFGRFMLESGRGCIVNVGSVGAANPSSSAAYGPSKAGLLAFTRQVAVEWGPLGIRANSVSPGMVRTPMSESFYNDDEVLKARSGSVPLRRLASTSDMANAVVFLASDDAAYINGHDLVADGGFTMASLSNLPK